MCSIIGFSGGGPAAPVLVKGLRRMEYRGYDSVGVATASGGSISLRKGVGKVDEVEASADLGGLEGRAGIGHTRWASHGGITEANAHPHVSGQVAVVHNGIIENFEQLRSELRGRGCEFSSETDTETISHLLQMHYSESGDEREAMVSTLARLRGHYAFAALFSNGTLAAARFHEPMIVGVGRSGEHYLSSDVLGFIEGTDEAVYIDNGSFVLVRGGLEAFGFDGKPAPVRSTRVSREFADVYKGDYAHYTIKEISEQPRTLASAGGDLGRAAGMVRSASRVLLTGSGSSYNAALVARHMLARHARVAAEAVVSSELPHDPAQTGPGSLLLAFSQSGESADVLHAARMARKSGARVLSLVNLMMSSLAHESDAAVPLGCGPEIGVAATKSFTAQLAAVARMSEILSGGAFRPDLAGAAGAVSEILSDHSKARSVAGLLAGASDVYVLGRGVHYPVASESALKLKELTYIHAEGVPGGELKHGPLALVQDGTPVLAVNPSDSTYQDTMTSVREIRARGARIVGISDRPSDAYDHWIPIPRVQEEMYPIVEVAPVQLIAYYTALERDADPDYPRNLAKSVTVR